MQSLSFRSWLQACCRLLQIGGSQRLTISPVMSTAGYPHYEPPIFGMHTRQTIRSDYLPGGKVVQGFPTGWAECGALFIDGPGRAGLPECGPGVRHEVTSAKRGVCPLAPLPVCQWSPTYPTRRCIFMLTLDIAADARNGADAACFFLSLAVRGCDYVISSAAQGRWVQYPGELNRPLPGSGV